MRKSRRRAGHAPRLLEGARSEPVAAGDGRLLEAVDGAFAEASRRAGSWLSCRPGCAECCVGPFPVTPLDARRLRSGMRALAAQDPGRASAVRARASASVRDLRDGFPGDPATGALAGDTRALDAFFERHAGLPCPALDPVTLRCDLYESRPVTCRTYGPPLRFGAGTSPPCRLCFDGAPAAEVERCRIDPDPLGLEETLLSRLERSGGPLAETLVAFALAGGAEGA